MSAQSTSHKQKPLTAVSFDFAGVAMRGKCKYAKGPCFPIRSYCDWIKRFVLFHKMESRDDMAGGEKKIEMFLMHQRGMEMGDSFRFCFKK